MLQIRLSKPLNEGGGAKPDTVTVACPEHLVLADLPVAKSLGSPSASAPLKIVGRRSRRQLGERVHFCVQCDLPIAVYGRLSPCEHVFCLDCARSDSLCFLCEERIQKIQTIKMMEGLLICAAPRCFKSFIKKCDLESHIRGNHMDHINPDLEKDGNDSEALSGRKPTASESTVQGPGRQIISHGSETHRLQPPLRNLIQPKPMAGQSPSRFSDQQLDNNPPPGFDRPVLPGRYGQQTFDHPTNFAMPPAIHPPPPQFGYNLVTEGVQQYYGGGGGGGGGGGSYELNQEQGSGSGSVLGFPPGPSRPWSMSPGAIFQGGGVMSPVVNKGSESSVQGGTTMEFRGGGNGQQTHSLLPPPPPPPYSQNMSHQGNFYSNEVNNDGQMFAGWTNEKRDSYPNNSHE